MSGLTVLQLSGFCYFLYQICTNFHLNQMPLKMYKVNELMWLAHYRQNILQQYLRE